MKVIYSGTFEGKDAELEKQDTIQTTSLSGRIQQTAMTKATTGPTRKISRFCNAFRNVWETITWYNYV
jgi:hypothetical protein